MIVESKSDREATSVEVIPPDKGETAIAQEAAARQEQPGPLNGTAEPKDAVEGEGKGTFALVGAATLRPQKSSTLEGSASALDSPSGTMLMVSVKLGTPGKYDVFLLDQARLCDERGEWTTPIVRDATPLDTWNLGRLEVSQSGIGYLEIMIPKHALAGGARMLEGRPIVIYEGSDKPLASKRPLSCGTMYFGTIEEPVG